jgi:anti-anti-sigma regulatory factor
MELLNLVDRCGSGEMTLDFSGIRRFEPFGVEVLVRGLGGLRPGGPRIRCAGLPPCIAERLRGEEVAVAGSPPRARWAPWVP